MSETSEYSEVSPSDWRWLWRRCSVAAFDSGWRFCADEDNPLPDFLAMRGLLEAHENGVWYREVEGPNPNGSGQMTPHASAVVSPQEPATATPPTPDRAAVRAAVAHADLMAGHAEALARETENPAMRETYARNASSLRTLLAHLTREAR